MDSQGPCTDSIGTVFRGSTWSITSRGGGRARPAISLPPVVMRTDTCICICIYIYIYTVHVVSVSM